MSADIPPVGSPGSIERPGWLRILWYSIGGGLPPRYGPWVLHDVTGRTWWVRHFARMVLVLAPLLAVYLLVLPSSWAIRLLTGLTFCGGVLMYGVVNIIVNTDRRAVKIGYPSGLASDLRSGQAVDRHRLANRERRERIAARQARRR